MKTFKLFTIVVFCLLSMFVSAQEPENISTNVVLWVKNCVDKQPSRQEIMVDDSSFIHIDQQFKVSNGGEFILYKMATPYNCLKWMKTTNGPDGEKQFIPDTDNCYAAIFVYSEKNKCWVGGIIAEIQTPLLEWVNISELYEGKIENWPQLKTRLNNDMKLRFCLCKFLRGKWRRSNWSYNFNIE